MRPIYSRLPSVKMGSELQRCVRSAKCGLEAEVQSGEGEIPEIARLVTDSQRGDLCYVFIYI